MRRQSNNNTKRDDADVHLHVEGRDVEQGGECFSRGGAKVPSLLTVTLNVIFAMILAMVSAACTHSSNFEVFKQQRRTYVHSTVRLTRHAMSSYGRLTNSLARSKWSGQNSKCRWTKREGGLGKACLHSPSDQPTREASQTLWHVIESDETEESAMSCPSFSRFQTIYF